MKNVLIALAISLCAALPLRADTPEELVRWIYTSLAHPVPAEQKGLVYLMSPAQRVQFMSERMVTLLNNNDTYGDDLAAACIDFAFDIPGQDFDRNEIISTLITATTGDQERQTVVASFSNFAIPTQVSYDFVIENGRWVIDDIAQDRLRASTINCLPKGTGVVQPAPAPQITSYCYQDNTKSLRLDVSEDGSANFEFVSSQANGHTCGGQGRAARTAAGWLYEAALDSGPCRIEFTVTPSQGIRLNDADWACKPTLCGQRAVIDGLTYDRETQVQCSMLRRN